MAEEEFTQGLVPGRRIVIAPESDGQGNVRTVLLTTPDVTRSQCIAVLTEMVVNLCTNPQFMQVRDDLEAQC
jgi:hypothetical protein